MLAALGFLSFPAWGEETKADVFDILEYRIEGNTVLARGKIEEVVYPYLGESKSIDDVE